VGKASRTVSVQTTLVGYYLVGTAAPRGAVLCRCNTVLRTKLAIEALQIRSDEIKPLERIFFPVYMGVWEKAKMCWVEWMELNGTMFSESFGFM